MKKIGFIGVGSIGAPMARCVIRAGFEVTICDTNVQALKDFEETAKITTNNVADCADQDMVVVMVNNDDQVKGAVLRKGGLLDSVNSESAPLLVIMSTVLPQTVKAVEAAGASKGVRVIDAPVSGLPVIAEQGKLTIMVGGEVADFEAVYPILKSMGENIFHTGPVGTGEVTKLVNNIIGVTNILLTAEAMKVGKHYGMDLNKLASIMDKSSGRNFFTQDWEQGKATYAYFAKSPELVKVAVDLCRKDLQHARELAQQGDLPCHLLNQISDGANGLSYTDFEQSLQEVI